jgi:putative ABC transport system permease protein
MEIRPILSTLFRNKTAPLLIAAQVALTLAIVCNALFIINDRLAQAARPSGTAEAELIDIRLYPTRSISDIREMQRRDLEAIGAVPGVKAAAAVNQFPLTFSAWYIGGLTTDPQDTNSTISAAIYQSGESLIDTFGLRLAEGRDFEAAEIIDLDPQQGRQNPSVVLVTRALAQVLFPGESRFVGRTFYLGSGDGADPVRIVGVIERLQTPPAQAGGEGEMSIIYPVRLLQPSVRYAIRAEAAAREQVMREVEKALLALRHDRVLLGNSSFDQVRERRYAGETLMAGLLIAVTAFLMLITASGIVGMASLWVNQRRKQIGVRRAMGARRSDIVRYFLVENLLISSAGVIAGIGLALLLNDVLVRELQLARLPLGYLFGTMLAMWLLGLAAVLAPALRASLVPPAVATRTA